MKISGLSCETKKIFLFFLGHPNRHVLLHVPLLSRKGRVTLKYNLQAVKKVLSIEAKADGEEVCMRRPFCSL